MSAIAELLSYAGERLLCVRILALTVLVMLAAWLPQRLPMSFVSADDAVAAAAAWLLAAILVAQCRLIDDLADLPVDRVRHPARVLVRSRCRVPFVAAAAGLSVPALALLPEPSQWAWALLIAALLAWYRWRRPPDPNAPQPDRVVLLKYPVFVLLIAGRIDSPGVWFAALVLYLVLVAIDEFDRPRAGMHPP
ncbi:MAG: hypothetical protein AB7L76_07070 [Burkholderiaceae bacterium]